LPDLFEGGGVRLSGFKSLSYRKNSRNTAHAATATITVSVSALGNVYGLNAIYATPKAIIERVGQFIK
jgi:hypothetical protein